MFYDQIEKLCHEYKISPSALGLKMGLSAQAASRWKLGSFPKVETLMQIADFFGVSVDYLLYGDDIPVRNNAVASDGSVSIAGSNNTTGSINTSNGLDSYEAELIRIYRNLDIKRRTELIYKAVSLENEQNSGKGDEK